MFGPKDRKREVDTERCEHERGLLTGAVIKPGREVDRQAGRQVDRQAGREVYRQAEMKGCQCG